ncbi:MAG TPA: hypothetical protein VF214_02815 [Edaphobacter sp.]
MMIFEGAAMKPTDWLSVVVSSFALVTSIFAFRHTRGASTSDYQAMQKVKLDTAALIAALRAMMYKGANYSQQPPSLRGMKNYGHYVDLTAEKKVVQDFLCSPTAIAYSSYLTERSKRAKVVGSGEEWRTFFLQVAELLSENDQRVAAKRAARLEKLFHPLQEDDFKGISENIKDLSGGLKRLFENIKHDPVVDEWMKITEPELSPEEFGEFVVFLRRRRLLLTRISTSGMQS